MKTSLLDADIFKTMYKVAWNRNDSV